MLRRLCTSPRRSSKGLRVLVVLSIAALSGCAERPVPVATVPARPLGRDIPVYQPAPTDIGRPDGPQIQNPTGTLSLRDAVALALMYSPDLAAFAWETRAREARILQAGRPPNPILGVLAEDLGASRLSGAGLVQPQATIQLSQLIELGGKRTARENLATLERDLAAWDYETARIDVLTQVTRAYIDVLAAQEFLALTNQTMDLGEQVQRSVTARVVAGRVSPIEQTRAEVALASTRVESARATRALDAARRTLAALWGSSDATFQSVAGSLEVAPVLPPLETLQTRVVESPDLARWASEISRRQAALALEQAKGVPDVSVTAGYRRFTDIDSNALLIGGSVALPIFDRNRGGIAEANSRLAKAYEERRAAQTRVTTALAESYRALSTAYDEITVLRSAVLPGARQTFEAVNEGYRLGRFGYLEVLDVQRTLVAAGAQSLRALGDYHKAVADVERLIGAPLNAVPATSPVVQ